MDCGLEDSNIVIIAVRRRSAKVEDAALWHVRGWLPGRSAGRFSSLQPGSWLWRGKVGMLETGMNLYQWTHIFVLLSRQLIRRHSSSCTPLTSLCLQLQLLHVTSEAI